MPEPGCVARYKLKLKRLDFISAVDSPAQETATALLVKRRAGAVAKVRGEADIEATARVVKTSSDELGLVFGWALTSKSAGADYFDLHGDNVVEDDLIRVAAEFMESGGASDEMHDFEKDGRVVFAMPLTAEVAKSFGIQTDTTGLMVAIKPSADVFAKFKSGEYTGFSIAGIGERIEVKSAARVAKHSLYTDEQLGHAHKVCVYEDGSLYVEYATMEGAEYSHSHGIVFEDGALTILADSGHTHALAEGQPGLAVVPADAIVVVQARAQNDTTITTNTKSTRSPAMQHAGLKQKEPTMPNEHETKIADLEKQVARLSKIAKLSGAHKAHFDTLAGEDADAFLAKSNADRDALTAEIAKRHEEAEKVVYVSKSTGDVYKAKDDARLVDMAKRMDEQAIAIEKAAIRKQAAELLAGMPGADEAHDLIVRSLLKSGAKQEEIDASLATLKGMRESSTLGKRAPGFGGTEPTADNADEALAALTKGLTTFAKAQNITKNVWTDGLNAFVQTDEGKALKRAYDDARNG